MSLFLSWYIGPRRENTVYTSGYVSKFSKKLKEELSSKLGDSAELRTEVSRGETEHLVVLGKVGLGDDETRGVQRDIMGTLSEIFERDWRDIFTFKVRLCGWYETDGKLSWELIKEGSPDELEELIRTKNTSVQ